MIRKIMGYKYINWDTFATIIKHPKVNPSANNDKMIRLAAKYDKWFIVRFLMRDSRVNIAVNNNEILRKAIFSHNYQTIISLIKGHALVGANNELIDEIYKEYPSQLNELSELIKLAEESAANMLVEKLVKAVSCE